MSDLCKTLTVGGWDHTDREHTSIPHPEYTWPPELDINSWPREPGLLNHGPTAEHVGWCCQQAAEWKEHVRRGEPRIQPHVRLVVVHGATGTPNGVLLGELGTIAQVIYNRLNQPRFENESYFPVCLYFANMGRSEAHENRYW